MMARKNAFLLAAAGVGTWMAVRAMRPMISLRGKTVLITGGSRGLGLVMARQCAAEGARVAICARDPDELERARHDLTQFGADVLTIPCDVSRPDMVERMMAAIKEDWGPIDVLINN